VLFTQFDWLLRISLHYSPPDKTKMASCFVSVADEEIFVLNEAAVSPNTKKAAKFCLTVCRGILKTISNE
jgi:hypothetical protein